MYFRRYVVSDVAERPRAFGAIGASFRSTWVGRPRRRRNLTRLAARRFHLLLPSSIAGSDCRVTVYSAIGKTCHGRGSSVDVRVDAE